VTLHFLRALRSTMLRFVNIVAYKGLKAAALVPRATFAFTNQIALFSGQADTVVATCTQKIADLLKPTMLKVTSSNDDPNGSHVRME
jgi:hypothetical protein